MLNSTAFTKLKITVLTRASKIISLTKAHQNIISKFDARSGRLDGVLFAMSALTEEVKR